MAFTSRQCLDRHHIAKYVSTENKNRDLWATPSPQWWSEWFSQICFQKAALESTQIQSCMFLFSQEWSCHTSIERIPSTDRKIWCLTGVQFTDGVVTYLVVPYWVGSTWTHRGAPFTVVVGQQGMGFTWHHGQLHVGVRVEEHAFLQVACLQVLLRTRNKKKPF